MHIINPMHFTTVSLLDITPLMMPTSVDCLSLMASEDNVSTFGVMLQGIMNIVPIQATAHVQLIQAEQLHRLLVLTFTVSLALTDQYPDSGTPPTRSGMAKAATVVAGAAASVVHRGSGSPCLRSLHLILKFAGASRIQLPMTKLALNNLKFTYSKCFAVKAYLIQQGFL